MIRSTTSPDTMLSSLTAWGRPVPLTTPTESRRSRAAAPTTGCPRPASAIPAALRGLLAGGLLARGLLARARLLGDPRGGLLLRSLRLGLHGAFDVLRGRVSAEQLRIRRRSTARPAEGLGIEQILERVVAFGPAALGSFRPVGQAPDGAVVDLVFFVEEGVGNDRGLQSIGLELFDRLQPLLLVDGVAGQVELQHRLHARVVGHVVQAGRL